MPAPELSVRDETLHLIACRNRSYREIDRYFGINTEKPFSDTNMSAAALCLFVLSVRSFLINILNK